MEHRSQNDEELPLIYREMEALIEARWLIVQEKETEALALLIPWLDDARQNGRVRVALEMQVLMALAHAARKQMHEARFLLQSMLAQASAERCQRLFLDEGAPMATLLHTMVSYLREPSLLAFLQTILQAFTLEQEGLQQKPNNVMDTLVEPLSPQELRVLRLLAAGRSNREIADELIVSVNTVRSHVQGIYRKLTVNNRVAASEMARHLHLL
jgi:LuxR family maltose regulon positive regulatory protein